MVELPAKVQNVIEGIENLRNTVEIRVEKVEGLGTFYWITFKSLEDHFLLETSGHLSFFTSEDSGSTKFGGGQMYASVGSGIKKFRTYQDMYRIIDVYTSSLPKENA